MCTLAIGALVVAAGDPVEDLLAVFWRHPGTRRAVRPADNSSRHQIQIRHDLIG